MLFNRLKEYIDEKFEELYKKLFSMKTSTECVVKQESKNVKTQIIMSQSASVSDMTLTSAMESFNNIFSIDNKDRFVEFDAELAIDDIENKLKNLFEVLIYGEPNTMDLVRKTIFERLFTTNLEILSKARAY